MSSNKTKMKYWKEKEYRKKTSKRTQKMDEAKAGYGRGRRYYDSARRGAAKSDGMGWYI